MEFTLVTVVIALLIVWYFGKPLNAVVAGTGEMASDEFAVMRREQKIRLHKERIKQTSKVKDLAEQEVLNDQEFNDFFNVMTNHKAEA
jgi:hypothetical protein